LILSTLLFKANKTTVVIFYLNNMNIITKKIIATIAAIIIITAAIWYLESLKPKSTIPSGAADVSLQRTETTAQKEKNYPLAKEIISPAGFINSDDNLKIQNLIGKKVILVDFWTYSCINCQRTLPYLTSWYDKYKDQGLEIIGVHTPEFEFEKQYDNVARAVEQYNIKYPVVLDNDYGTWQAYGNRYWPRKYLIDIDGFIVYDHIGEGGYEETEKKIQSLLSERASRLGEDNVITKDITAIKADSLRAKSPEIYFGANRNSYLDNGQTRQTGEQVFIEPAKIKTNFLYLTGKWNIQDEYAKNLAKNVKVIFRYQASDVFFVAEAKKGARLKVLLDGEQVPSSMAGSDVNNGIIDVNDSRLYKAIETNEYGEHTLELIIEDGAVDMYTFTFG